MRRGPSTARPPWPPLAILPAYGAQCYGDIGFQSLTCGLILGVAMAVAGKVCAWADARCDRPRAGARRPVAHPVGRPLADAVASRGDGER